MNSDKLGREPDPDAELVKLIQDGSETAFAQLIKKHQQGIYHFVRKMINDEHEAEDITQEIFVRVYRKINAFRFESKFTTWLYRVAYNVGLNYVKKLKTGKRIEDIEEISDEAIQQTAGMLNELAKQEKYEMIKDCIDKLPAKAKTIVTLHLYKEMPFPEIAQITNMKESTVKRWWYEIALPKLYNCLKSKGVER